MATAKTIPAVIIGVHRSTAIESSAAFEGTPYQLVAVLDLCESPDQYQYNPQHFGAVLYALHPRPRILITGTAVGRIVPEVKAIWDEYVGKLLKAESDDGRSVYVPVSNFHSEAGPPPPGTEEYLMEKINAVFKPTSIRR